MANKPKRIIILQGGENIEAKTNKNLFKQVLVLSKTKNILVIPWTTDNPEKEKKYRKIIENYFKETGFKKTIFLEKNDTPQKTAEKFNQADIIYLPGGNPQILYSEIKKRPHIETRLKEFKGIIIGNSAGAIVLSKGTYINNKYQPGLALVNHYIKVHYILINSNNTPKPTICIPENHWIAIEQ